MAGIFPVIHVVELSEALGLAGNGATCAAGKIPAMTESVAIYAPPGAHARPFARASSRVSVGLEHRQL